MQVLLAENIRRLRRDRHLTQEQLAEVLGVAVGTVSKWESGSSTPDLALIMELADFFGTSVDVLLGYRQQSTSLVGTLEQLRALRDARQYSEGRRMAEKAVKQFPNSFDVAYQGAMLYDMAALESRDHTAAGRAKELYTRALELMDQNTDPKISRVGIYNSLASIALSLDETDRAVELLKQNNVEGLNNAAIGQALARGGAHRDEALDYLEIALLRLLAQLTSICMGYLNTGESGDSRDTAESRALILVVCGFFDGLRQPGSLSPMDKYIPVLRAGCALLSEKQGLAGQAEDDLRAAFVLAQKYDASPVGLEVLRFIRPATLRQARVVDDMGPTARDGVEKFLQENQAEYPACTRSGRGCAMKINRETLTRRRQFTRQFYRGNHLNFVLALTVSLLGMALNLAISWLLQQTIDLATGTGNTLSLPQLAVVTLALLAACVVFDALGALAKPRFLSRAIAQYREYAYAELLKKNLATFTRENTSTYLSALSNDANSIEVNYLQKLFEFSGNALLFAGSLAMMFWYSPPLALAALAFSALPLAASVLTGPRLAKAETRVSQENEGFVAALKEGLSGFSVVKSFQAEREALDLFVKSSRQVQDAKCRACAGAAC